MSGELTKDRRWFRIWRLRWMLLAILLLAGLVMFFTNKILTQRYTETTRNRAEVRLALYSASMLSELQRNSIVPQLLARDPELIGALEDSDYSLSTARLLSFVDEIGAASLMLLDKDGRAVATTDRNRLGENHRSAAYFVNANRSNDTVFAVTQAEGSNGYSFVYARKIESRLGTLGVITVAVDMAKLERNWAGLADAVFVMDSEGSIIISTEPSWRGLMEEEALERRSVPSAIQRAILATQNWTSLPIDAFLRGQDVLRRETRVPFQGWRMVTFTTYATARDQVNAILALEVMGFAILLAGISWLASRQTASRLLFFQRESAELRALNERLQREIAEREKVEKDLKVAELTLEQSSKLAALGEMSAAVSHELNQPLAAMKTYLAGARLLLTRKRSEEAMSSFQRIDDLIDRMGTITRQLKSYARKGSQAFEPLDTRDAVSSALTMMEPQLKTRRVEITRTLPATPAMISGDRLRLEQVIINLLRNALDATKMEDDPQIDVLVAIGETVTLTVRDNGPGIDDLDELFEPFYTTKEPGDGLGLGLAISSGIVNDLGGRLIARNGATRGAVFEVRLPPLMVDVAAAE